MKPMMVVGVHPDVPHLKQGVTEVVVEVLLLGMDLGRMVMLWVSGIPGWRRNCTVRSEMVFTRSVLLAKSSKNPC